MRAIHSRAIPALLVSAVLTACGGGGDVAESSGSPIDEAAGSGATKLKGRFVDSPVTGLSYSCVSGATTVSTGLTTLDGEFDYVTGSSCTFKIGGITLGTAAAAALLTPVQLVPGAVDETNPTVNNMVRLLMSLDADANPGNGIAIDSAVSTALAGKTLDFTLAPTAFATQASTVLNVAYPARTLTSATQASTQFSGQLLGLLAGNFSCAFTGAVSGTATLTIATGSITGTGTPTAPAGPSFGLSGTVSSSGNATIGGATSTGAAFAGSFTIDGQGSGTWADGAATGTWTCSRT